MKIYAGNLSYETTEQDLRKEFEAFGAVESVALITDQYSGRSKGFAFIEMSKDAEAQAAISALNGKSLRDRTLTVNTARPRTEGGGRTTGGYGDRRSGEGRQQRDRY